MSRSPIAKIILYITLTIIILFLLDFLFITFPSVMEQFEDYRSYINAGVVLVFGWGVVKSLAQLSFEYFKRITDEATAATIRSIVRIIGLGVLFSLLSSVFNINAASALTLGSFMGMVIGFATQKVLNHAVSGIFIIITRPFKVGDTVTVAGQSGKVKDIRIMYTLLETDEKEILIPSGTIIGSVIHIIRKKEEPKKEKKATEEQSS
ncbi:small-conductance mechanosensitive channel-like protein [Candidatus Bathyarchaeota archaeon ex4484_205]|nr:MAG: small-conductance mechanosensitive channel-like protein [Candidatus Bathyarchaeota archaeon ex4484_205]RLG67203.1 MAG: mechanosensitive ion channel family protein [archaeon]